MTPAEKKLAAVKRVLEDELIIGHSPYIPMETSEQYLRGYNRGRADVKGWTEAVAARALRLIKGEE